MLRSVRRAALAVLALALPAAAGAQNRLVNGGFEDPVNATAPFEIQTSGFAFAGKSFGDCTTFFGSPGCAFVQLFSAGFGDGLFRQTVNTTAGETVRASVDLRFFQDEANGGVAFLRAGGIEQTGVCAVGTSCSFAFDFIATAPTATIEFGLRRAAPGGPTQTVAFDNAFLGTAVVPEPGTWALLGTGLLGLAGLARRRRA